jgi:hypothetical protein
MKDNKDCLLKEGIRRPSIPALSLMKVSAIDVALSRARWIGREVWTGDTRCFMGGERSAGGGVPVRPMVGI